MGIEVELGRGVQKAGECIMGKRGSGVCFRFRGTCDVLERLPVFFTSPDDLLVDSCCLAAPLETRGVLCGTAKVNDRLKRWN